MDKITSRITVFFEEPFWVAVCELETDGMLEAAKVTFGAEPKSYEVYEYLLINWYRLRFSPPVTGSAGMTKRENPKRVQRAISKHLASAGVGTKAQQALKLQQEQSKAERSSLRRDRREEEKQRQFELRQKKKKEKHKGH